MRLLAAGLLLVSFFISVAAVAAEVAPRLARVEVLIQLSQCEPEAFLRRRVERRLGARGGSSRYWVSVTVSPADGRVNARVTAVRDGVSAWTRELSGDSCADVSDAAAVIVAVDDAQSLDFQERLPRRAAPKPEPDPGEAEQERSAAESMGSEATRQKPAATFSPGMLIAASTALAARLGLGAILSLDLKPVIHEMDLGRVSLGGGYWFPVHNKAQGERVTLDGWMADAAWLPALWPLARPWTVEVGGNASFARVHAEGAGIAQTRSAVAWRAAVGPRLNLRARFGRVGMVLRLGVEYSLVPQRFFVQTASTRRLVHALPTWGPSAALGLDLRL